MEFKKKYLLIPLAVVLITWACKEVVESVNAELTTPVALPLKRVQIAEVKSIPYDNRVYTIGKVASKQETKLSFKTGGVIQKIFVNEGQTVRAGALLAELDMEEMNAKVQQAVVGKSQAAIQLKSAEVLVEKLERDFAAVKALYADKVATLTELKDTKTALDNARIQVEAARSGMAFSEENQKIANYNRRLSKIVAPSSGIILKRLAESSEIVGPGSPVFLFGSSNEALVLRASVTDKDIVNIDLNNQAEIKFDAYPGQVFKGTVTEIAGISDPYTGTYELEISLPRTKEKLLSGFIGEASIQSKNKGSTLAIPIDAMISANGSRARVYVVENGIVRSKSILIGSVQDEDLIVLDGLEEGEQVITKGANYVSPNDSVVTEIK